MYACMYTVFIYPLTTFTCQATGILRILRLRRWEYSKFKCLWVCVFIYMYVSMWYNWIFEYRILLANSYFLSFRIFYINIFVVEFQLQYNFLRKYAGYMYVWHKKLFQTYLRINVYILCKYVYIEYAQGYVYNTSPQIQENKMFLH